MAARLGYVLYWFCCIVAGLAAWWWYSNVADMPKHTLGTFEWGFLAVLVGVPWLIGRALRFVLAGE